MLERNQDPRVISSIIEVLAISDLYELLLNQIKNVLELVSLKVMQAAKRRIKRSFFDEVCMPVGKKTAKICEASQINFSIFFNVQKEKD